MSATLKAAVKERVEASPLKFFGGPPVTTTAYPYVIGYFDGAPRSSDREADEWVQRTHGFQTVVVGSSEAQVDAARERLSVAIEGWRPTVDGRAFSRIENDGSQPTRPDPTMPDRTLYIATDQWRAVSDPT